MEPQVLTKLKIYEGNSDSGYTFLWMHISIRIINLERKTIYASVNVRKVQNEIDHGLHTH